MAWRCTGNSNSELVDNLYKNGIINNPEVANIMKKVDRKDFCNLDPYQDSPQEIGYNATISAPHMHAYALESLFDYLKPGSKALDVGCGSGFLTACMSKMVGEKGKVIGIDHIPGLVELAERNIKKNNQNENIQIVLGDGRKGYSEEAPYDCIHVGAASQSYPKELVEQLKSPGKMLIPIGTLTQEIYEIIKDEKGQVSSKPWMGVRYVPLTDPHKQWPV